MNITQLEYFVAAGKTLNFTRAASACFTSRQNLSHAIRDLEKELGVTLFSLEGGSLALTVEGVQAVARAQRIVDEVKELKRAFASRPDDREPLEVLVGLNLISCTPYDVSSVLESFGEEVRLGEYSCKECYERVSSGLADIAIVGCMDREFPKCESELIGASPLFLLVSENSELALKDQLEITDLAGHRIAILPDYEFQFEPFIRAYKSRGLNVRDIDVISNVGLMLRTVRKDDSVGIASMSFKANAPSGTVVMSLADTKMRMNLYVLHQSTSGKAVFISELISELVNSL